MVRGQGPITDFIRLCTPIFVAVKVKGLEVRSGFCKLAFDERAAVNSVLLVVETSMKKRRKRKTQDICSRQEVGSNGRTKLVGFVIECLPIKLMTREMGGIVC